MAVGSYRVDGIARNITLDIGDMLLIESNNVIHGRPFALQGTHVSQEILDIVISHECQRSHM